MQNLIITYHYYSTKFLSVIQQFVEILLWGNCTLYLAGLSITIICCYLERFTRSPSPCSELLLPCPLGWDCESVGEENEGKRHSLSVSLLCSFSLQLSRPLWRKDLSGLSASLGVLRRHTLFLHCNLSTCTSWADVVWPLCNSISLSLVYLHVRVFVSLCCEWEI